VLHTTKHHDGALTTLECWLSFEVACENAWHPIHDACTPVNKNTRLLDHPIRNKYDHVAIASSLYICFNSHEPMQGNIANTTTHRIYIMQGDVLKHTTRYAAT
jgi:hypothetical protein